MTVLWARRAADGLFACDPESAAQLAALPAGKTLRVEVSHPRNVERLRLFWLMCQRVADAVGTDRKTVANLLKIETGHYTLVRSSRYGDLRLPRSIALGAMDETAFKEFFERAIQAICETWGASQPEVLTAMDDLQLWHHRTG